jgi:hypothetical protein
MAQRTTKSVREVDIDAVVALTEVEKAYIAGFFDGEGTIGLYADRTGESYGVQVAITQTNPAVLLWLHETFGGSLLHCVNRDHKYDYNFYELQWRGISSAGLFLKRVLPYLREKREQAELFLTYNTDMDSETRCQRRTWTSNRRSRRRK